MTDDPIREAMKLPEGKTCKDCFWWKSPCSWLIASLTGDETTCDWSPSKFKEKADGPGVPGRSA